MASNPKEQPKKTLDCIRLQKNLTYLPFAVSSLRLVALPLITYSMGAGQPFFAAVFFLIAIASDLSDGYFARRFNVASNFGSKFDAAVDFIFIIGIFTYFVIQGLYPSWILAIVGFMFAQFVITSRIYGVNYDPLGKYYGGFLYGAIGLTIVLFETRFTHNIILLLAGITVITLISRLIFLVRKTKK